MVQPFFTRWKSPSRPTLFFPWTDLLPLIKSPFSLLYHKLNRLSTWALSLYSIFFNPRIIFEALSHTLSNVFPILFNMWTALLVTLQYLMLHAHVTSPPYAYLCSLLYTFSCINSFCYIISQGTHLELSVISLIFFQMIQSPHCVDKACIPYF